MHGVSTMAFITHCWKNAALEGLRRAAWLACVLWGLSGAALAQNSVAELTELHISRSDNAVLLDASLKLELGSSVEEALIKGLAIYFVVEVDLMRDRWYWYDRQLGTATRHYRLAYQPLARRWRLNVSREPLSTSSLAASLTQNFETLTEALASVRRISGWKVADMADIDLEARQYMVYRFRLDTAQLPRPFQLTAGSQSDWNLSLSRTLRLHADMLR